MSGCSCCKFLRCVGGGRGGWCTVPGCARPAWSQDLSQPSVQPQSSFRAASPGLTLGVSCECGIDRLGAVHERICPKQGAGATVVSSGDGNLGSRLERHGGDYRERRRWQPKKRDGQGALLPWRGGSLHLYYGQLMQERSMVMFDAERKLNAHLRHHNHLMDRCLTSFTITFPTARRKQALAASPPPQDGWPQHPQLHQGPQFTAA